MGLGGGADPDYQLSTFTCASRSYKSGGDILALSDSFYCNPEYDKLYEQQKVTIDPAKRAEIVKQMQRMLYMDAPYVVTAYYDDPQACRSDRFTGFQPQPDPDGVVLFQYGTHSYATSPRRSVAASGDGSGKVPLVPIAVGVARGRGGRGAAGDAAGDRLQGRARVGHPARWPRSPPGRSAPAPASAGWPQAPRGPAQLAFVLVFNFFLFRVLPGDPAKNLTRNRLVPAEQVQVLRESFGLGKPLPEQFATYVKDTLSGDLGISPTSSAGRSRR